ncbi:MAG: hypothetical protein ACRCV9_15250 [Burkholderiaceae bacterium]
MKLKISKTFTRDVPLSIPQGDGVIDLVAKVEFVIDPNISVSTDAEGYSSAVHGIHDITNAGASILDFEGAKLTPQEIKSAIPDSPIGNWVMPVLAKYWRENRIAVIEGNLPKSPAA